MTTHKPLDQLISWSRDLVQTSAQMRLDAQEIRAVAGDIVMQARRAEELSGLNEQ